MTIKTPNVRIKEWAREILAWMRQHFPAWLSTKAKQSTSLNKVLLVQNAPLIDIQSLLQWSKEDIQRNTINLDEFSVGFIPAGKIIKKEPFTIGFLHNIFKSGHVETEEQRYNRMINQAEFKMNENFANFEITCEITKLRDDGMDSEAVFH